MCYPSNKIRYVTVSDFDSIFGLLTQLWIYKSLDKGKMKEMFEMNLNSSHITYICSIDGDLISGFCSLTVKNNLWQQAYLGNIDELVVDQKYRKKGIGKAMMDEITKIARQKGCVQLELDSSFHREEAHKFYRNLGFESRAFLFTKELK